jgi:hypothetical protein
MNPVDRIVGPTLPANRLRRVEERRRERNPQGDGQPPAPAPVPRKPGDERPGPAHHIDELA